MTTKKKPAPATAPATAPVTAIVHDVAPTSG